MVTEPQFFFQKKTSQNKRLMSNISRKYLIGEKKINFILQILLNFGCHHHTKIYTLNGTITRKSEF